MNFGLFLAIKTDIVQRTGARIQRFYDTVGHSLVIAKTEQNTLR
jgi:hypothetical protein